ncbi:hypothetical protein Leryth_023806 [Lithospermum erythrorhizon]|nr:hypothetical protein Leryth_023806 [Lithospermum erythrorhizon]
MDDISELSDPTFRVKIAGSRDRIEKLNMDYYQGKYHPTDLISWALFQQQSHIMELELRP